MLAVDAELRDLRAEVARLNRDLIGQESDAATRMMEFLRLFDEVETLRAALAASQTRESTLRETLTVASGYIRPRLRYVADRGFEARGLSIAALLADPSPLADALGRVVRAGVAERKAEAALDRTESNGLPSGDPRVAALASAVHTRRKARQAEVDNLLVVAPHWGEPRGGG